MARLPFVEGPGLCVKCGRESPGATSSFVCDECRNPRTSPAFDRAACALRFEADARDLVLAYKFNGALWLRDDFADFLAAAVARFPLGEVDAVAPMPLSLLHRFGRGYNQCAYMAKALAARIGKPYRAGLVSRKGNPRRQSSLGESERRENAKGTFAVRRPDEVKGKTILVVDDIKTTGATLSECARALKEAGAAQVWCAALAQSVR